MKKLFIVVISILMLIGFGVFGQTNVNEFYDFVYKYIDNNTWSTTALQAGSSIDIDRSKHYGEVVLEGNANGAAILLVSGIGASYMLNVSDNWELEFRAKANKNYNHPALGASHDVNNLILWYFSYDSNWRTLTRSGGLSTDNESNIEVDDEYHVFKIIASSSSVKFYYDAYLVSTHTTNISSQDMFIQVRLDLLEAGQDYLYLDWIKYSADRT